MSDPEQTPGTDNKAKDRPRQINVWLFFGLIVLGFYIINYRPDIETVACNDEVIATEPDVIMLGTWWCPYCAEARQYFHENNVHYCEYDIERTEEGKQRYADVQGRGIPVLIFGNKYRYDGYDERIVERALALLQQEKAGSDDL